MPDPWSDFVAKNPGRVNQRTSQKARTTIRNTARGVRHKFGAVRTERDGLKFDSKLEASYYDHLKRLQEDGTVLFFLRQTRFDLPGNVRYACDFQVFYSDGIVEFVDVKGQETKEFKRAKKQVEALYPVEILVVKRGDF